MKYHVPTKMLVIVLRNLMLFFMFLFLIPFTIRQQCIIYPHKFSIDSCLFCAWWCLLAFGASLILVDTLRL